MKPYCWLLIVTACSGTSQVTNPNRISPVSCPVCPEPEDQPKKVDSPPATSNWHCIELHRPNEKSMGLCWWSSMACEEKRRTIEAKNMGTSSLCATQRIAYCVGVTFPMSNIWQAYCSRTPEGCQETREILLRNRPSERHKIDPCRALRNMNPFDVMERKLAN